jgi:hypothetical protein
MPILDKTFFRDEAWFRLNIYINSQNTRIWATENPHTLYKVPLLAEKMGVWCAVSRRRIVRLYLESTVDSAAYRNLLRQFVAFLKLDERDCWFH